MTTVHHLENSRSQRILWLLEELNIDYKIKRYKRDADDIRMSFALEAAEARADLSHYPKIAAFLERMLARPAYQTALKKGGPYSLLGKSQQK